MASDTPVEVYAAKDSAEAYFVRNLLADAGIEAFVVGEALRTALGDVPINAAEPRVWVREIDEGRARPIIEAYQRRLIERTEAEFGPKPGAGIEGPATEPFCYHCGQPVQFGQSPCPACGGTLEWDSG
jgi:hypothetical protein